MSTDDGTPVNVSDSRRSRRFVTTRRVLGNANGTDCQLIDLSAGGLQLEHAEPLKVGTRVSFRVVSEKIDGEVPLRGRVVWSRLSQAQDEKGRFLYRSGVCFDELELAAAGFLGRLIRAVGRPDLGSLERKRQLLIERVQGRREPQRVRPIVSPEPITTDQLLLVAQALTRLQARPEEMDKYYQNAKLELSKDGGMPAYGKPVIAIWGYLEGKIELPVIDLAWKASRS